jgi:predicted nucleic acid-binding protein
MNCMTDKFFLDTNILVYAHDRLAGWKHERATKLTEQLWNEGTGVISTQVLQEFCYTVRRKLTRPLSLEDTFAVVQQYLAWNVVANLPTSVLEAIQIEARYRISFWDALILHAALRGGAKILYTEDFSHGQLYGEVRAVNPFLDR